VPLDGDDEALVRFLDGFDGSVPGISRGYDQAFADSRRGLMVARVYLPFQLGPGDDGEVRAGDDIDRMSWMAQVFCPDLMPFYVLDKRAALLHVEDLQSAAYAENGKIARQSVSDERALQFVADVVGFFGQRTWCFSVESRVDVNAAHEYKAVEAFETLAFNQFNLSRP
jgi:hypothetical protein